MLLIIVRLAAIELLTNQRQSFFYSQKARQKDTCVKLG